MMRLPNPTMRLVMRPSAMITVWSLSVAIAGAQTKPAATRPATSPPAASTSMPAAPDAALGDQTTGDQFARPVDEVFTEEMAAETDLSAEGNSFIDQIFQSEEHIRRLMGDDVSFIYNAQGLRDPMIIPWIRREIERRTLLLMAEALEQEGRLVEALDLYEELVVEYPGSPEAARAQMAISRLGIAPMDTTTAQPGERTPVLPIQIRQGLTGLLFEASNPVCLIGEDFFMEGDQIPNLDVTVLDIQEDAVIFLYQGHEFRVTVATY